jgi:hypothetical protein
MPAVVLVGCPRDQWLKRTSSSTRLAHQARAEQAGAGAIWNVLVDASIQVVIVADAVSATPHNLPILKAVDDGPAQLVRLGRRRVVPSAGALT